MTTQTQHKTTVVLGIGQRWVKATAQCFLRNGKGKTKYPPVFPNPQVAMLICGEDSFHKIATKIRRTKTSIGIIWWGSDPAMALNRQGATWPRGTQVHVG